MYLSIIIIQEQILL